MMMEGLFGVFAIGCGLYCLYNFYMLKAKKEISNSVLLPKGVNPWKCKDKEGYIKEAGGPLLLLGVVTTLYGVTDLYSTYAGTGIKLFGIMLAVLLVTLVFFVVKIRKINKKYFGI